MGDLVNLRGVRKAKARAARAAKADANRLAFGRTAAERTLTAIERERAARHVDNHRLADGDTLPPPDRHEPHDD